MTRTIYKTNMVFVDVSNDISKKRLIERNVDENVIENKLNTDTINIIEIK